MDAHLGDKPLVFSVVVPVYNSQEFVERCIDSVLSQEHEALELILVDDGSTDDSFEICSSYSATDQRVRVIKKENGGPFSARLAAYPYVTGDYVLHVDADDILAPWALAHLADAISRHPADVVFFEFSQDEDFKSAECRFPFSGSVCFGHEDRADYLNLVFSRTYCLNSMCTKAIKADLLKRVEYPANMLGMISGEDLLQSLYVLNEASNAYYLDEGLYYYRLNSSGTTLTFRFSDLNDYEVFYRNFHELLKSFCDVPGFVLTETDNDRSLIFGNFRYLQNAARQGESTFHLASGMVRDSKDLAEAMNNVSAKKRLRFDAAIILRLVLSNFNRLAYVLLATENRLHELMARQSPKHYYNLKGETDGR